MLMNASTMLAAEPKTAAEYQRLVERVGIRKGRRRPEPITLLPYVNEGRWVANCVCNGGIAVHPEWAFAGCLTCGRGYTQIAVPIEWQAIEAALALRPDETTRNWLRHETVDDLHAETARHEAN